MLSRTRTRLRAFPQGPWILGSAIALAVLVSPFAVAQTANNGTPVKGGARNPSEDQRQSYTKETEIIADTATYGTRQSNKSSNGGGAIYGCRSGLGGTDKGNEPCIRANNLEDGRAFEFASSGKNATEVGVITAANPNAAPLTTNAQGVATGFNADRVDSKNASDIVADAQAQNRFAAVAANGELSASRDGQSSDARLGGHLRRRVQERRVEVRLPGDRDDHRGRGRRGGAPDERDDRAGAHARRGRDGGRPPVPPARRLLTSDPAGRAGRAVSRSPRVPARVVSRAASAGRSSASCSRRDRTPSGRSTGPPRAGAQRPAQVLLANDPSSMRIDRVPRRGVFARYGPGRRMRDRPARAS